MLMLSIIFLLVSLPFESLLKMKSAPSNIIWLLSCSMVLSSGSQDYRHETIHKLFGSRKKRTLTIRI